MCTTGANKALQAAAYLNANGDFTFRRIQLGPLEMVKRRITFRPGKTALGEIARDTLGDIGRVLASNRKLELHIVAYVENDAHLAKLRAKAVKQYLAESAAGISPQRLKISWFSVPEKIQLEDHTFKLDVPRFTYLRRWSRNPENDSEGESS
jgi:outer membrane protein OmpA-like peptidoglycan-associated protein